MKQLLYFLTGTASGIFIGFVVTKRHYEQIMDEEIESVKEAYKAGERTAKDIAKANEIIRANYISHSSLEQGIEPEVLDEETVVRDDFPREERSNIPYVISYDDYADEFHGFEKAFVIYWAGNDTLTSEEEDEILDIDECIGRDALDKFGVDEAGTVFVRNERYGTDYEVYYNENSFRRFDEEEDV